MAVRGTNREIAARDGTLSVMQSKATTVAQYLSELPAERRAELKQVRRVILKNLDKDYQEGMQYGMIGYSVPHAVYPPGYHCDPKQPLPFTALASQKNHLSLYLGCVYGSPEEEKWFRGAWQKSGKKLDMGKSCIRFKKAEDLPLDVIGEAIRRMPAQKFIAQYEATLGSTKKPGAKEKSTARPAKKKATSGRTAATKSKSKAVMSRSR